MRVCACRCVDVLMPWQRGETVLMRACRDGQTEIVALLLESGLDHRERDHVSPRTRVRHLVMCRVTAPTSLRW